MRTSSRISLPAGLTGGKIFCFFLFIVLAPVYAAVVAAQNPLPRSDFQIRNDVTIVLPVMKGTSAKGKSFDRISVFLLGVLRLGQNRLYPVDERVGGGFDFLINRFFAVSTGYLYRTSEPLRNRREFEHRLFFDLTAGYKWKNFTLKDRNRVEYRFRNSRPDIVRYRNKFTFAFRVPKDKKEVFSPFLANEVFYDFHEKDWSMNEFSVGITRKLSKSTAADFYFLRRDSRSGQIRSVNALGVSIKIHL
ncbi:MAG: hypothetical protein C4325_12470 [Blastocatellia bacterium]